MYNKIIMIGNLTKDIEMRYASSGTAIATTSLASNRKFKKQDGTQGEEVCFVQISAMARTAEIMNQYLNKGSKILIEGRLKLDTWVDKQSGANRSKHSIQVETMKMLSSESQNNQNKPYSPPKAQVMTQEQYNKDKAQDVQAIDIDNEIPF